MNFLGMRIGGRERHSVVVKRIRAVRAKYLLFEPVDGVEIEFITDENVRLTLQVHPNLVPNLVAELRNAYEAINPPLGKSTTQADFYGME